MLPVNKPSANSVQNDSRIVGSPKDGTDWEHHPGRELYFAHCAACHEGRVPKAPHRSFLEALPPRAIISAMAGVMRIQAEPLDQGQREAVATWLSRRKLTADAARSLVRTCASGATPDSTRAVLQSGWGYDNRRFAGADSGLNPAKAETLSLRWAIAFPEATRARSQPAFAFGAIYVGSEDGTVYALDPKNGCSLWTSNAGAEVRTGIVVDPKAGESGRHLAYFGDLLGRVHAVDAITGRSVWRTRPDDHPSFTITGTPALAGRLLLVPLSSLEPMSAGDSNYLCCTFSGGIAALDTRTGATVWIHRSITERRREFRGRDGHVTWGPSGAPVWNSPTIDMSRNAVYFGTGENYSSPADGNSDAVIAISLMTGRRLWTRQLTRRDAWNIACMVGSGENCPVEKGPDHDIGASVMLVDAGPGRQLLIAGDKSGWVTALDPGRAGQVVWRVRAGRGSVVGGIHFGMAAEGHRIYVPVNDRDVTSLGTVPQGVPKPGMVALEAATGREIWRTVLPARCAGTAQCAAVGISSAVTAFPGGVVAGSTDGILRIFDGSTGRILWSFNTTTPQMAASGVVVKGGGMSGPGPLIANGMVIVNSGYGVSGQASGNALLAFGIRSAIEE